METNDWIVLGNAIVTALLTLALVISNIIIGSRQNKIELSKIYKSSYNCLYNIKTICDQFFYHIEIGITSIVDEKERFYYQFLIADFDKAKNDYKDNKIYIKLYLAKYPHLVDKIDALLWLMQSVYSTMNSLQMPYYMTNGNYETIGLIEKMIKIVSQKSPECFLTEVADVTTLSDKDYRELVRRVRNIMLESSWTLEEFAKASDEDSIKHVNNYLSMLTDDVCIDDKCKQMIIIKNEIFSKNNILKNIEKSFKLD